MADTIREKIIQAVLSKLAIVTVANGFNFDLGANVERGITHDDPANIPKLSVWAGREEAGKIIGAHVCNMNLRLEALLAVGSEEPSVLAEKALGDLIRAVCGEWGGQSALATTTGGMGDEIIYRSGGIESWPEPEQKVLGVPVEFIIKYRIRIGDPYNQP